MPHVKIPKKNNVQSILFNKHLFSVVQAMNWLKQHGFCGSYENVHYPDETKNYYRFRQYDPIKNEKYITRNSKTSGIKFVIGY